MSKNIYIASDHAGYELKTQILSQYDLKIIDLGTNSNASVDYPDFANFLIKKIKSNENSLGILICGSGIGMSIAANRDSKIRAGIAFNPEVAKLMRQHNNANVIVLPGRFINIHEALNCINNFLTSKFELGRHKKRIDKLN